MVCGIYCRISKEDALAAESESIQNQRELLVKYANERAWSIYQIYQDEDYSGIDTQRPQFKRLIKDCREGRIDIVLCKSQARFTRDMAVVEQYIHGLFVEWGVRFIGVADNVDTDIKGGKKSRQITGLVNQWYLEDLSENIKLVLDHKRREGKFIGSFASYGYLKDPTDHNKLVIDPVAAEVVRLIYRLYAEGNGKKKICDALNTRSIPNPTAYKQQLGLNYKNGSAKEHSHLWNKNTVGRILTNPIYTGDMVQGVKAKPSYRSHKLVSVPKDQWMVAKATHPPIIPKEVYHRVSGKQSTATQGSVAIPSTTTGEGEHNHPLWGRVFCKECGSVMQRTATTTKGKSYTYLRCKLHMIDRSRCSSHSIPYDPVLSSIEQRLDQYIDAYYPQLRELAVAATHPPTEETQQNTEESRIKAMELLYLDRAAGIITQEEFRMLIGKLKPSVSKKVTPQELPPSTQLPRELLRFMVERVEIEEKDEEKTAVICWRF